ncbi:hypothetical protein C8R28_105812 [Nitrosomonas ureae]|uniref:Uncharacterized protein n=1 Tax=Nitrosomonas ureae TaxID=44577 RepID=A0A2T5I5E0_9PROT|nr:hypothetical protein C8R28_105812 [Nitrosomonas ureae]
MKKMSAKRGQLQLEADVRRPKKDRFTALMLFK